MKMTKKQSNNKRLLCSEYSPELYPGIHHGTNQQDNRRKYAEWYLFSKCIAGDDNRGE
jgi:hypothetical protein